MASSNNMNTDQSMTVGLAQVAPVWLNRALTLDKITTTIGGAAEREIAVVLGIIEHQRVREERQNFDPVGPHSRPDVTRLTVNRQRQSTLVIED